MDKMDKRDLLEQMETLIMDMMEVLDGEILWVGFAFCAKTEADKAPRIYGDYIMCTD